MASTDPREWMFQGWIASRLPWFPDQAEITRVGNGLLAQFPNVTDAVYDEARRIVSFREKRESLSRMDLSLATGRVSLTGFQLERAADWRTFGVAVIRLLHEHTNLFEAKFNLLQVRQSVYIPIRSVPDPGKRLFEILGNDAPLQHVMQQFPCGQIGNDQEFVFSVAEGVPEKLTLRFQTCGLSLAAPVLEDQILITASAVLDPKPENVPNIVTDWEKAQDVFLEWLSNTVHPGLIAPLIERLG